MALHSDQIGINQLVGENIRLAGSMGLLTDQNVIDSTTYLSLKNFIDANALTVHADTRGWAYQLKAAIQMGYDDGTLTDAAVAAATGVNNLASLTQSDPGKIGPIAIE